MCRKHRIDKPYDFAYRIMHNEFPQELHNQLKIPGKFKRKSNVKVHMNDGRILEMDSAYIVEPDYKEIFEPMAVNCEHQSGPVDLEKIKIIGYYGIQQMHDENLPQLSVIASHIEKEKHVQMYQRSPSDIVQLYFLDLGWEDNKKRLNNLNYIINQQDCLSDEDALNIGIIPLFAPRDCACEITEKSIVLYGNVVSMLSQRMKFTLYSVLHVLTDAFFDDENEFRRVMTMLDEKSDPETVERFVTLDLAFKDRDEAFRSRDDAFKDRDDALNKVKIANARISELEKENNELKNQLKNVK